MSGRREWLCYTDGACKAGEDAPGGWGYHVVPPGGPPIEGWGAVRGTLAKVMEYRAVAEALAVLPNDAAAVVFSDDQSLVENLGRKLESWRRGGFASADPQIKGDLVRIDACIVDKCLDVRFQWVRGHNGNAGNERADQLAARGAREAKAARPR